METAQEMLERKWKEMQTIPHPICLTKMDWAAIIGLLGEAYDKGLTDDKDIRWHAAKKLQQAMGLE